jgi:ArsR family transcriptional regulator, arsenate/arsenite/antimonite-responsive transcriptional repressor
VLVINAVESRASIGSFVPAQPEVFTDWADLFTLLSDRTRLRILYHLSQADELHVGALCERLDQRQPAVSHHLSRLRAAGVITARRDGKLRFYRLLPERVRNVLRAVFSADSQAAR